MWKTSRLEVFFKQPASKKKKTSGSDQKNLWLVIIIVNSEIVDAA